MNKKAVIGLITGLVIIFAAVAIKLGSRSTAELTAVPDTITSDKIEAKINAPEDASVGTAENPFLVLEIVPNISYAEIGYLIPGEEPIDMNKLVEPENSNLLSNYKSRFCSTEPHSVEVSRVESYCFPDEVKEGEMISEIRYSSYVADGDTVKCTWDSGVDTLLGPSNKYTVKYMDGGWILTGWPSRSISGYYEYVGEGNGLFRKVETSPGQYSFEKAYHFQKVSSGSGEYTLENQHMIGKENGDYVKVLEGSYRWVTAENTAGYETNYNADQIWTQRTDTYYFKKTSTVLTHNDNLIKDVFDRPSAEVEKEVVTVTPHDFLNPDNLRLIQKADMIYIHGNSLGNGNTALSSIWDELNTVGKNGSKRVLTDEEKSRTNFVNNDLPWEAVEALMSRMSEDKKPALILTEQVYNDAGSSGATTENNCHKLVIMLRQYGPKVFKQSYMDTDIKITDSDGNEKTVKRVRKVEKEDGWTTGVYTKKDGTEVIAWNESTFYPEGLTNNDPRYLIEAGMKNPTFNDESQWQMVQDNTFFYKGGTGFLEHYLTEIIRENEYNGEAFDYYEELWGVRHTELTTNEVTRFLLQNIELKKKLKILELQPTNQFIYGSENWKAYYLSLFPWFEGDLEKDVEVVTMPVWEFNSKIQDLNAEYDAIIIGAEQNAANGLNGYNDEKLNYTYTARENGRDVTKKRGFAYIAVGDKLTGGKSFSNAYTPSVSPDDSTRYSAIDITDKKLKELLSYMNAGRPIILDLDLMNTTQQNGKLVENGVDTAKVVDRSTKMYQLVSMYDKNENVPNLFVFGMYKAFKLKRALAYENCKIEFVAKGDDTGYPKEYSYTEKDVKTGNVTATQSIDKVDYNTDKQLRYTFKIVGRTASTQKYSINLFIDMDGDGIFAGSQKELEKAQVNGVAYTAKTEQVSGIKIVDQDGVEQDPNNLSPNIVYTLTRKLGDDYVGILPWKLEAVRLDLDGNATACRDSESNYTAVESKSKQVIRVLMMNTTPDMTTPSQYFNGGNPYNESITWAVNSITNFTQGNVGKKFKAYLSSIPEFDVRLVWMENDEWTKLFNVKTRTADENYAAWKDYLDNGDSDRLTATTDDDGEGFDMIILGFADDCTYTSNEVFHRGFMDFVNQGKGVILSHDMSRAMSETKTVLTNYDEDLRRLLGQRLYATNAAEQNGELVNLIHSPITIKKNNNANNLRSFYNGEQVSLSYTQTNADGSTVQMPGYIDNATTLLMKHGQSGMGHMDRTYEGSNFGWNDTNDKITEYTNQINSGQITNYPYKIPELIQIGATHSQSFQLNMNTSIDSAGTLGDDVVVWYGLTDQQSKLNGGSDTGVYSSRESDGANNYYIYNKGNITYTGLGHLKDTMSDVEIRLFVNTMIASYRASAPTPNIEILNEDAITDGDNVILYVNSDELNPEITNAQNLTVRFTVNDPSLTETQRDYVLNYRYTLRDENGDVQKDSKGNKLYDLATRPTTVISDGVNGSGSILTEESEGSGVAVYRDGIYTFDVPYSTVVDDGVTEYDLVLNERISGKKRATHLTIMQTPLFTLN